MDEKLFLIVNSKSQIMDILVLQENVERWSFSRETEEKNTRVPFVVTYHLQ